MRRGTMTTRSTQPAIVAVGLHKSYGAKTVFDGIDLHVPAGTIFSLLGPNGGREDHDSADPVDVDQGRRRSDVRRRA
jgi:hypothetical protein